MARSESFTDRPDTLSQTTLPSKLSCLQSDGGPYIALGTGVHTSKRREADSGKESVRPKGGGASSAAR
jgi:hypothetical protein